MKRIFNDMIAIEPVEPKRVTSDFFDIPVSDDGRPIMGKVLQVGEKVTDVEVGSTIAFNPSATVGPYETDSDDRKVFYLIRRSDLYYEL